ncbi:hypothetical protein DICVIV_02899 [Dictyocaulus viviparus]|uniref:Uncharacterized protein n=1 Tax=Dictyocaulus viviparus TaxID=29172 RepID=A0A0D8Y251_DICVI|nr:hypothetical protein DICVIV_02899 [Dictyocaulus viviparus]
MISKRYGFSCLTTATSYSTTFTTKRISSNTSTDAIHALHYSTPSSIYNAAASQPPFTSKPLTSSYNNPQYRPSRNRRPKISSSSDVQEDEDALEWRPPSTVRQESWRSPVIRTFYRIRFEKFVLE